MIPQFSVIMPFFNAEKTVGQAIESVLGSTIREFEFILVDDGSMDKGPEIARSYGDCDARLIVLPRPHAGIVEALNAGLEASQCEYVARMDADDICHPDRFELQLSKLQENPDLSLVSCLVEGLCGDLLTQGMKLYLDWVNGCTTHSQIAEGLFIESPIPHPSAMFRKDCVTSIGGYKVYDGPEDYDLWLRILEAGGRFEKIAKILLKWRIHEDSLAKTDRRYRKAAFIKRKFEHALFWINKNGMAKNRKIWIWGAGRVGGVLGKFLNENNVKVHGYIDIDPKKIGSVRHGVNIFSPEEIDKIQSERFYIGAVGTWTARRNIASVLKDKSKKQGEDFIIL